MPLSLIQKITVWAIPILLSVTLHEAAHAWVATRCGDTTAKRLGRLSLNPLNHLDPVGTVIMPLLIGVLTQFQFIFGWAKPVPVSWTQLRHPRRDSFLVSAAGPGANLIMAILWTAIFKLSLYLHPESSSPALFLLLTAQAGIWINLILAFLNLLPIPPLDGGNMMASLLPPRLSMRYLQLQSFGFFILILLLLTGALSWLLNPLLYGAMKVLQILFQL